jgi:hypothetical protein
MSLEPIPFDGDRFCDTATRTLIGIVEMASRQVYKDKLQEIAWEEALRYHLG